jgi:hypothetical protein
VTLPSDLERLGDHLEVAALRAVRRRARRQTALNAVGALAASALLAIALTAGSGPPARRAPAPAAPVVPLAESVVGPAEDVSFHHVRDQPPPASATPPCVNRKNCGRPSPPTRLMFYPDPARRA